MTGLTQVNYRNFITLSLVWISIACFLAGICILSTLLLNFYQFQPTQFYQNNNQCPQATYLSYLSNISITEILFFIVIGIATLASILVLITLIVCYRRQNKSISIKGKNLHIFQIVCLMIALVATICAFLHKVTLYSQITQLRTHAQNDAQLLSKITTYCFSQQIYTQFLDQINILLVLIIFLALLLLSLLICFILIYWIIFKIRLSRPPPLKKQPIKKPVPTLTKKYQNYNQQVDEDSLISLKNLSGNILIDYQQIGIGQNLIQGNECVSIGVQTKRVKKNQASILAKTQTKQFGCGENVILEQQQQKQKPDIKIMKNQSQPQPVRTSRLRRTQLSQYHMSHPQQMRASRMRASQMRAISHQPKIIRQIPKSQKKPSLSGYYFYQSSEENQQKAVRHSLPKIQNNQQVQQMNVSEQRLPYKIYINRQFAESDPQSPRSNRKTDHGTPSNRRNPILESLRKSRMQKIHRRKKIFQPVGAHKNNRHHYQKY